MTLLEKWWWRWWHGGIGGRVWGSGDECYRKWKKEEKEWTEKWGAGQRDKGMSEKWVVGSGVR